MQPPLIALTTFGTTSMQVQLQCRRRLRPIFCDPQDHTLLVLVAFAERYSGDVTLLAGLATEVNRCLPWLRVLKIDAALTTKKVVNHKGGI